MTGCSPCRLSSGCARRSGLRQSRRCSSKWQKTWRTPDEFWEAHRRRPEVEPAAHHPQPGGRRRLDAGRLATSTGRRYFINVADAGIGAEVVRRAARGPAWVGGTGNFLGGAVVSLLTHRNASVRLRLDDGPVLRRRIRTIAVANGAFLGGGMWIAPKARTDDGIFEVVTIGDVARVLGIRSLPML